MKQGFGLFADGGNLAVADLPNALRSLGSNPSKELLEDFEKELSSAGGTTVDFPEFLTMLSRAKKAVEANGGIDAELEQAFKVYNRSQTGVITANEIFDFYKSIGTEIDMQDVRRSHPQLCLPNN